WNAGDWNDPPAGTTGALDTFGQYLPMPSSGPAVLTASINYSPAAPQVGQSTSFNGSASAGTAPYSFAWSFGDGVTATGSVVSHAFAASGTFNVTLTVTDSSSMNASTSLVVRVFPLLVTCSAADFNHNGRVDILDVSIFALHFGRSTGDPLYDSRFDLDQ